MSQKYTQDGVELVVAGLRTFQNNLKQAGVSWDSAVQGFRKGGEQLAKTGDAGSLATKGVTKQLGRSIPLLGQFQSALKGAGAAGAGMSTASLAAGVAVGILGGAAVLAAFQIGKMLVKAIRDVVDWMKRTGTQALKLAGEFQEMEFAALAIGRAMGKSKEEIQGSVQEMVDMGIRVDKANKIVAQFTRHQLDLASAVDLVRIAQATGIMTQQDSSEEMETLVHAALSGNAVMLRHRGIFIDAEKAVKDYADELGRDVDTLNQSEKAQARLNAIVKSGAAVLDVYGAAMQSPTKQLRSLTSREIPTLLAQLGAPFLDAWATAVNAIRGIVKAFTEATREGGTLYPILVNLGAAAALLADGFNAATKFVVKWIENLDLSISKGLIGIIEKMFTFGFKLVAFFAEGIVTATTSILIGAMKLISRVLTSWLAPSSPPKVAPDITQWGIDVMAEYLRGFTLADFSILEGILAPLGRILKGPDLARFSQELIAALAGGGELTESFYERIARAAGMYGKEVTELTRRHVELIRATEAAAAAEKRLEQAQKGLLKSQQQISVERREYNEMLREGASKQLLAAQMLRVRGAEEQTDLAQDELKASEAGVDAAEERKDAAKEQYDLQSKLVNQLLAIRDAYKDIRDVARDVAKAVAGIAEKAAAIIPEIAMPDPATFDITSAMSIAIDKAKERLKEKFAELFKPLTDAWDEMKIGLERLGKAWYLFELDVIKAWDALKEDYPFLEELEEWVVAQPPLIDKIGTAWRLSGLITGIAIGKLEEATWFQTSTKWMLEQQDELPKWSKAWSIEGAFVQGEWEALEEWWDESPLIEGVRDWIQGQIDKLPTWKEVWKAAGAAVEVAWEAMEEWWNESSLKDGIEGWLQGQIDKLPELKEAWRIFKEDLISYWNDLRNAWGTSDFWDVLIGHSPSPLEEGLRGINRELHKLDASVFSRVGTFAGALSATRMYRQPAMAAAPIIAGSTTSQHVTVDIGDVYISSREEGDIFSRRIEDAVLAGLRAGRV